MVRGRKVFLCLWAICIVLGGIKAGIATDWVVEPGIEATGEYLNNINYSPTLRQSDYILSARPNVSLSYNSEVTKLEGSLALLGLHYITYSELDRINQYYRLNGSHKVTPRLSLNLGTSFTADSTSTEELSASGVLVNRQLRNAFSVSPGLTYFLTERLSTTIGYTFDLVDYQSQGYNSYKSQFVTQGFDYLLNEKTTLKSLITATYSKYDAGSTISSLGPQIGFGHKFSENWEMLLLGGVNVSRINSNVGVFSFDNTTGFINVLQNEQTSTNVAPFFTLGTNYRWETGSLGLNYTRNQSPNAYGNQSQYNNFYFNISQNITEKITFNLNPYIYNSTINSPGSDYTSNFYGIRPGLLYKLTERTSLGAYYGFAYRTVTGTTKYSFPVNDVWLTLSYKYPLHYQY
jgi:hypothetical protein